MKFCFYSSASEYGGHEVMTLHIMKNLLISSHEVCFYGYSKNGRLNLALAGLKLEFPERLNLFKHNHRAKSIQILRSFFNWRQIFLIVKFLLKTKPDIFIVTQGDIEQGSEGLIAGWISRVDLFSYIPMVLDGRERQLKLSVVRDLASYPYYFLPKAFLVISDYFSKRVNIINPRVDTFVVPNLVNEEFFSYPIDRCNAKKILKLDSTEFTCGFVGRLSYKQKGLDRLIDLILFGRNFFIINRLVIYGDGPDKERFLNELKHKKILECIKLMPWQTSNQPSMYDSIDCLLLVSKFEGVPLVILEALSRELFVITTPIDSIKDRYPVKTIGRKSNDFHLEEFFQAIKVLSCSPISRNSEGRNFVRKFHSEPALNQALTNIFD